jgi:MIP family channel proteins
MVYSLGQKLVAEFVGTFALVLVAAGAVALGGDLLAVALAYGLIVLAFTYAYGDISGGHLNPAVTVGAWIVGSIEAAEAVGYIVAQVLGGIVAAFVLAYLLGGVGTGLGATLLAGGASASEAAAISVTPVRGFVLEAVGAFVVVSAVLHTAVALRVSGSGAAVPVGLAYVAVLLFLQPLTGGALNPARAIGPAVATGNFTNLWVYIAAPLAGAAVAALLYKAILAPSDHRW